MCKRGARACIKGRPGEHHQSLIKYNNDTLHYARTFMTGLGFSRNGKQSKKVSRVYEWGLGNKKKKW
jgi:hypothetical protein